MRCCTDVETRNLRSGHCAYCGRFSMLRGVKYIIPKCLMEGMQYDANRDASNF
jgi:hypothetical protein